MDENVCQTQKQLAQRFYVAQQTIFDRLQAMGDFNGRKIDVTSTEQKTNGKSKSH